MSVEETIELLEKEYGTLTWQTEKDPVAVMVKTILSQNTSDMNSKRAYDSLISKFGSWEEITNTRIEIIAEAIKSGGLGNIKAKRIKMTLQEIQKAQGSIDLSFIQDMPLPEAKAYLQRLPGVGPKTASCVLLFSMDKPALPVDTHVFRVARRLGLIDLKVSPAQAHELLEKIVPYDKIYQFHLHMIEHGRRVCHARQPSCRQCVLRLVCSKKGI
jgi:endonuclease-3